MENRKQITIDGKRVFFDNERNLLEVIRKTNIEIPTFCYHSELSIYGACRLCIVDIEGRGIQASCSIPPEEGMVVKTNTEEIRKIRKINIELLLASYNHNCPTCGKNTNCKLQELAHRLGVKKIRYKKSDNELPIDTSSDALVRDPNKCILCGDCVRACEEIQGIGAIDFINRGASVKVQPAFNKNLSEVNCVDCGQCARVCPTGAIMPKSETDQVWKDIFNPEKMVIAQIAPAVRVAIGEAFGRKPGSVLTGQTVAALKALGFDKVFDTSFTADLTVIEEANEFIERKRNNENLPLLTSCCPSWVKYAEQFYPEFLNNISSCRSPQQMFGSLAKKVLPKEYGVETKNIVIVSVMPCTAKKSEAKRPEFYTDGIPEVDHVITTQELVSMMNEAGVNFNKLSPESLDMPFGFKTGAGVIFGNSGGVSEAVLRYAYEKTNGVKLENADFHEVRGKEGIREISIKLGGNEIKMAIVQGLKNASRVMDDVKEGRRKLDMIEVMSCPGGCIGGAGQPVCMNTDTRDSRKAALYEADKMLQLHKPQENPFIKQLYAKTFNGKNAIDPHEILHTKYYNRKRISGQSISILGTESPKVEISVCVGTNCFVKGSQQLLRQLLDYVDKHGLSEMVSVKAGFCMENCEQAPNATFNGKLVPNATLKKIIVLLESELALA